MAQRLWFCNDTAQRRDLFQYLHNGEVQFVVWSYTQIDIEQYSLGKQRPGTRSYAYRVSVNTTVLKKQCRMQYKCTSTQRTSSNKPKTPQKWEWIDNGGRARQRASVMSSYFFHIRIQSIHSISFVTVSVLVVTSVVACSVLAVTTVHRTPKFLSRSWQRVRFS